MSTQGERTGQGLVWELERFHPAGKDATSVREGLSAAATALERAAGEHGRALLDAYCSALCDVSSLLALDHVVREVSAPAAATEWAQTTEPARLRCQTAFEALERALGRSADALLAEAEPLEAAFLRHSIEARRHHPSDAAAPWASLARRLAFERLAELHGAYSKMALVAELRVEDRLLPVRRSSLRALLSSPDRATRRAVWEFRRASAAASKPMLAGINALRAQYRAEEARLLGYGDVLEAVCAEFRIAPSTYRALGAQHARVRAFAERFFRYKRERFGLASLEEVDLTAQLRVPEPGGLAFDHVVGSLLGCVGRLHEAFPSVLSELVRERVLLTDPSATSSSAWFAVSHYGGGTPLVHVPYHGTIDDFCAGAHELGHACHKTVVARERGPLAAADEGFCYAELFALAFEIAAVHSALEQASSADEREFWLGVVLEQAAHFLRTLPIRARFDELTYLEGAPADAAWARAHEELSPAGVPRPGPGDDTWVLSTSSEDLPFQGKAYALAFLVAYLGYLEPERELVPRLLSDGPWLPFEQACRSAAAIDIADPSSFDAVWEHLERLLSHGGR